MRLWLIGLVVMPLLASSCSKSELMSPGGSCTSDLSGTWDIIATRLGNPAGTMAWVMTIDANSFTMSNASGTLSYTAGATKQLIWLGPAGSVPISLTNVPTALNAGSVPLALGGNWTFTANDETCTVSVSATSATGSCQGAGPYVGSGDWPYPLPSPRHGQVYTATHLTQLSSQLGELGGQWQLTNGASGTCMVTVEGSRITGTCTNAQPLTGSLQLTLGTDCVASGSSGGYELSARRR